MKTKKRSKPTDITINESPLAARKKILILEQRLEERNVELEGFDNIKVLKNHPIAIFIASLISSQEEIKDLKEKVSSLEDEIQGLKKAIKIANSNIEH